MSLDIILKKAEKLQLVCELENWYDLLTALKQKQTHLRANCQPHDLVHSYFGTRLKHGDTNELATIELDQTPFGQSLRVFKLLYQVDYSHADPYRVLVSMVGFSLEPVMHTLLTLQPDKVILVFSQESLQFDGGITADDYINFLITNYDASYKPVIEKICLASTDTAEVFVCVHEKIKQCLIEGKVAIDVTGGKKSMDAAAFLAAAMHEDVGIYYVDYESYNKSDGYPIWGTEFLNKLLNPYDLFSVKNEHLIRDLWKKGNFYAVIGLVASVTGGAFSEDVARRYCLMEKRNKFDEIGKAAACYEAWSRFDYHKAKEIEFEARQNHKEALDALAFCSKVFAADGVCDEENIPLALKLAIDRYMRGSDAKKNQEWNRAALCYTQSVEAMLRYCFLLKREEQIDRCKKIKLHETAKLLNSLFGKTLEKDVNGDWTIVNDAIDCASVFCNDNVFNDVRLNVLYKRNELSHYECVIHGNDDNADTVHNMQSIMTNMDKSVKAFLVYLAERFEIGEPQQFVDDFCGLVAFLHLDGNLDFQIKELSDKNDCG